MLTNTLHDMVGIFSFLGAALIIIALCSYSSCHTKGLFAPMHMQ